MESMQASSKWDRGRVPGTAAVGLLAALSALSALYSGLAGAQIDLTGNWTSLEYQDLTVDYTGPDPVDYKGLPINDAARTVALSYSAEESSLPEEQCLKYTQVYRLMNPIGFLMRPEFDPVTDRVVAWEAAEGEEEAALRIWMDGRPPPGPWANHEVSGFTTGAWEGNVLATHTTQMKRGYLRRNGVPLSERASLSLRFIRHGNLLTLTGQVDDSVYLTEPLVISRVYIDNQAQTPALHYANRRGRGCAPAVEVAEYAKIGTVPHYLPGRNPAVQDQTASLGIPQFAVLGGAATMYPEFRARLKSHYTAPAKCEHDCCEWDANGSAALTVKSCPTWMEGEGSVAPRIRRPPAPILP